MSEIMAEWTALLLFLGLVACAALVEIRWLVRNGWAASGRASVFVVVTDLAGLLLGAFVVLAAFFVMFMMVMGPAGTGSKVPESAYFVNAVVGLLLPVLILVLGKRVMLAVFKIRSGNSAWVYSLVASISILALTLIPPPVIFYVLGYSGLWK